MKWLEKLLLWKCPLLPSLTFSQWIAVCAGNFLALAVYWLGRWLDWWPTHDTVANAISFLFVVLAFTPLDFTGPRVVYMVCGKGADDFHLVSRLTAWQARRNPELEVHRVWIKDGEIVHGERLK